MSRNTKIILAIVLGVLLLCGVVVIAGVVVMGMFARNVGENMFITDPTQIAAEASKMMEYDLPSGYSEQVFMNVVVGKVLMIAKSDEDTGDLSGAIIMVMQLSSLLSEDKSMSQEEVHRQLMQSMETQTGEETLDLELVSTEDIQVAGQDTVLYTYEGTDSDGDEVRQVVTGFFKVNNRQTIVMALGPLGAWPAEDIEAFLDSIR